MIDNSELTRQENQTMNDDGVPEGVAIVKILGKDRAVIVSDLKVSVPAATKPSPFDVSTKKPAPPKKNPKDPFSVSIPETKEPK